MSYSPTFVDLLSLIIIVVITVIPLIILIEVIAAATGNMHWFLPPFQYQSRHAHPGLLVSTDK